ASDVGGHARYSSFQLVDTALGGSPERSLTMLYGLREEGTDAMAMLWVLSREIRLLHKLINHEQGIEAGLRQERVWEKRKACLRHAAQQHNNQSLAKMLHQCQQIDQSIKGVGTANVWDLVGQLTLCLAGTDIGLAS
ncbi:MAG TPA: DNA polymerase III subunit delta, partial [Oceanospirillaceae bacterium]|nr:DNA polymerase III subunit delta [Oceanospirillaceae bacterium]